MSSAKKRFLCRLSDLEATGSKGVALHPVSNVATLFVVRYRDSVVAYRNECPHTGVPMDWQPDRFLDLDGVFVICGVHGARFRIGDGHCVQGPCVGESLSSVPIELVAGKVLLLEG
ncbi:MAG TPA: Rieske (2Fe-2S) protein [Chromatiaceae bacterium]|jgi:nitrite reductase/ring-hydroxylating ferredoxin subunit|nr:Rieske (2Fe-2S) protein [Chromatiaceae bacterium]HIA08837.1 Rieske (2Fe-2S) protein [Chromatiaceae bacterium]HIB85557.1 Rieske (2Fe-2S) protein [Chromatiaceae bacterium]HIN82392.1 Rieske (2Fe-2S) protein [Chromatiales bacterium]HIO53801.1 Rieske (2Fe-2S) protein [Chromatiales bacterium]